MNSALRSKLKRLSTFACSGALVIGLAGCGGGGIAELIEDVIPILSSESYAAIAHTDGGGWSFREGYDSAAEAESAALMGCRQLRRSATNTCKLAFPGFTSCGAIAIGNDGKLGFGIGPSRQDAVNDALNQCRGVDSGCRIDRTNDGDEAVLGATC